MDGEDGEREEKSLVQWWEGRLFINNVRRGGENARVGGSASEPMFAGRPMLSVHHTTTPLVAPGTGVVVVLSPALVKEDPSMDPITLGTLVPWSTGKCRLAEDPVPVCSCVREEA